MRDRDERDIETALLCADADHPDTGEGICACGLTVYGDGPYVEGDPQREPA